MIVGDRLVKATQIYYEFELYEPSKYEYQVKFAVFVNIVVVNPSNLHIGYEIFCSVSVCGFSSFSGLRKTLSSVSQFKVSPDHLSRCFCFALS